MLFELSVIKGGIIICVLFFKFELEIKLIELHCSFRDRYREIENFISLFTIRIDCNLIYIS